MIKNIRFVVLSCASVDLMNSRKGYPEELCYSLDLENLQFI